MNRSCKTHLIERTSPYGGKFIGTCRLCGKRGLTLANMEDECENVRDLSEDEALIEAIEGDKDE